MLSEITPIIALILSVISLIWQWRDKRTNLRVRPQIEIKPLPIVSDGQGGFEKKNTVALCIYLTNPSEKAVHISGVYIKPRKSHMIQLDEFPGLDQGLFQPFTIEPLRGRTFTVWGEKLAKLLQDKGFIGVIQANVIAQDEVNRQYKSRLIRFTVNQLRNQIGIQEKNGG